MSNKALFTGLIVDEYDQPVETSAVGDEPMYVVNDQGFHRHISSELVDRAVLAAMKASVEGHEDLLTEQAAKMMGQEDPFSMAMLENQFKNMDDHFEKVLEAGLPDEARMFLGMAGFKVRINVHGDILEIIQPGIAADEGE
jgi:hypothetical protein